MLSRTFIATTPENNGVSQNCREFSCSRRCTTCSSLHLREENRLRFSKRQHFSHIGLTTISFCLSPSRFLVVGFFLLLAEFQASRLSVAWKSKNAPTRDVRLNNVNWSLTSDVQANSYPHRGTRRGGGVDGTPPRSFWYVAVFWKAFTFSGKPLISLTRWGIFSGGGAAWGLWCHQQWSPSWPPSWI